MAAAAADFGSVLAAHEGGPVPQVGLDVARGNGDAKRREAALVMSKDSLDGVGCNSAEERTAASGERT